MRLIPIFISLFFAAALTAQSTSDPAAHRILESLKGAYESFESIEMQFDLILDFPEQDSEVQSGTLIQKGTQYMVQLPDQAVYSDGEAMWVHLKSNNEVQINNVEEDDEAEILSPKDLLNVYDSDDYSYALVGEGFEGDTYVQKIEFVPLDKYSEYSKMRISVDKKKNRLRQMKVFSKDGSRYTFIVKSMATDQTYSDNVFRFDASQYPNVYIEDLRID